MKSDKYYIDLAYKEAIKAYNENEIPVGAVIVLNGKVIAKAHNERDSSNIVTKHAEIIAIEKANRKLKNWRLNDCILYSTLEPCNMCKSVIKSCKISKVIYSASANNPSNLTDPLYIELLDDEYKRKSSELIQSAFKNFRNRD